MKTIYKIFIILVIIIIGFLYFGDEYKDQITKVEIESKNKEYIKTEIKDFDLTKIIKLEKTQLYYTPYDELLDSIVNKINNAENKIYLSSYIFTEKRIKNAIIKARKRGLEVKVIMEKDPYMAYNINDKFFEELNKKKINVAWSNQKNYLLNHAKFIIIDDLVVISTGNISYSTFKYNRDFFVVTKDKNILKEIETLFINDYKGIKSDIYHPNIVLSPNYSRKKIDELFEYAKKEIKIYMQYFNDDKIVENLIRLKKNKNIDVKIIISKKSINDKNTIKLLESGIEIKTLKNNKMHSKAILVDNEILFIGSINFSKQSLDKNRELGILIKNENLINDFNNQFYYDFKD